MLFALLCCAPCLEIIIQLFLLAEARIWITVPEKRQVLNSTFLIAPVFRIKIRPYYLGLRIWIRITANCKDTVPKIRNKWNCNCCNCVAAQFHFWEYINRILFTVQAKTAPNKTENFHVKGVGKGSRRREYTKWLRPRGWPWAGTQQRGGWPSAQSLSPATKRGNNIPLDY